MVLLLFVQGTNPSLALSDTDTLDLGIVKVNILCHDCLVKTSVRQLPSNNEPAL